MASTGTIPPAPNATVSRVDAEPLNESDAARLYAVARALTGALTAGDVADAVFHHALVDLGASTAGFWLLRDDGVMHFAGGAGHTPDVTERVGDIPLDSDLPAAMCVRSQEVVAYGSMAERDARWPSLRGLTTTAGAVIVLPLFARARPLGCLHIGYAFEMDTEEMAVSFLLRLAELCAAALDRAQLYDTERSYREQLEFLSDATSVLIRSLEPRDVLQALVDIAVPRLADSCAVLIPHDDLLQTVANRASDEAGLAAESLAAQAFPIAGDSLTARCFRSGRIQTMDEVTPSALARLPVQAADLMQRSNIHAGLIVPIHWAGQPIGVLTLGFSGQERALTSQVQETAQGLALRAGVALHNAGLYDNERRVAHTLAEALLPATTPVISGFDCAVRYLPAAGDVAGDWYDVLELDGRFLVGVGDAAGHGIPAATLMAELRNAARGLAAAGHPPEDILNGLAALVDSAGEELFATAVYGVLDPAACLLEWAIAGHPPPALIHAGTVELLATVDSGTPIASGISRGRERHELSFDPGDALVLFTDGVIERRDANLDEGLADLMQLLSAHGAASADFLASRIVTDLCADASDDCSVLVLRRRP